MRVSGSTIGAALMVAVFGVAAFVATHALRSPEAAALETCGRALAVGANDGAQLPATLFRCDAVDGRHPALVVWPREPGAASGWVGSLAGWAREGRTLLAITAPRRPGLEAGDLAAVIAALALEPATDVGRIGAIVEGGVAHGVAPSSEGAPRAVWPEELDALVVADPPQELRAALAPLRSRTLLVLIARDRGAPPDAGEESLDRRSFAMGGPSLARSAERADAWLRDALDVAPGAAGAP